ncbi:DUF4412 domain-containing protein [Fundidesulfovibrio soli]|uniref:DUF4412 domain-containing protein n=1 Tax=Fundidesulfovibrio soli TaxID=2922716 RepID=UPI001FB01B4A|nr:DUF4412 domain-containing protein [Fundidesulfovibrio soli]
MNPILSLALALALLFPAATGALAADFAADMLLSVDGKFLQDGVVYVKGSRMRLETAPADEMQVFIIDQALGKAYMLQAATKSYLELPLEPKRLGLLALAGQSDPAKWRRIGRETIGVWDCEKRIMEFRSDGASGEVTVWFPEKLGYVIKSVLRETGKSITMEYKNIRPGSIAAGMFTVPADYRKAVMPPAGLGMAPGMVDQDLAAKSAQLFMKSGQHSQE